MTTAKLAVYVMVERGVDSSDETLAKLMAKRVGACLRDQRIKGNVRSEPGADGLLVWRASDQVLVLNNTYAANARRSLISAFLKRSITSLASAISCRTDDLNNFSDGS